MTSFPKDHAFPRTVLEERVVASLAEVPTEGAAPGRYVIGAPSAVMTMSVTMHGAPLPPGASGAYFIANWQGQPTIPLTKSLVHLRDAIHLGQDCVVDAAGAEFPESTTRGSPARGEALARQGGHLTALSDIAVERVVEEPVMFIGNATGQFGHFLLDFMGKCWAVEWARAHGLRIAVHTRKRQGLLDFQRTLLRAIGVEEEDILFLDGPARLRQFWRASPLYHLHRGAHPDFVPFCASIADAVLRDAGGGAGPGERVYLSRRLWAKRRVLANEAEVEAMLGRHGYAIVHPETLTLPEQIRIARDARYLAAPIGSQTYLSLFQARPAGSVILAPSTFTFPDDAIISALRRVPTDFVLGEPLDPASAGPRDHDFRVDAALLERVVAGRLEAVSAT